MNAALKPFLAATTLAAAALAAPGDIVSSFTVPGLSSSGPRGLAFDGGEYYAVADNRGTNQVRIYKFAYDGASASVVSSFNCPTAVYWAMDLAWRPGYIYVANDIVGSGTPKVIALNETSGSLASSFNSPFGAGKHVNGLAWDGSYLWAGSYDSSLVYRLTSAGSAVGSFAAAHALNNGLAFDGTDLWLVAGRPNYDAQRYTTGGAALGSFTFTVNDEYVGGACWGRPTMLTLFVSTYTGGRYIYEISTGTDVGINVAPMSFGKIKALFR